MKQDLDFLLSIIPKVENTKNVYGVEPVVTEPVVTEPVVTDPVVTDLENLENK